MEVRKESLIKRFNLDKAALIEASAGTGKTFTITYLVLRLLLGSGQDNQTYLTKGHGERFGPLPLENILIVTFTRAATSDLRARIREKIRQARIVFEKLAKGEEVGEIEEQMQELVDEFSNPSVQKFCARVLLKAERSVDNASICTIHSFCNTALNQIYAFEAGEAFKISLVDDPSDFEDEACISLWRKLFYKQDTRLPNYLLEVLGFSSPQSIKGVLQQINRVRLTDFKQGLLGYRIINASLIENKAPASLDKYKEDLQQEFYKVLEQFAVAFSQRELKLKQAFLKVKSEVSKDDLRGLIEEGEDGVLRAGPLLIEAKGKNLQKDAAPMILNLLSLYDKESLTYEELDALSACKFTGVFIANERDRAFKKYQHKERLKLIAGSLGAFNETNQSLGSDYDKYHDCVVCLLAMLCQSEIETLMRQKKVMSNDDVLKRLDFALNCRGDLSENLAKLIRLTYPVAIIDEFQDTDPTQYAIFEKLYLQKEINARCYLIGDPKQSIYAFRGSDINSYLKAKHKIEELSGDLPNHGIHTLDCNYRSAPQVVEGVNHIFNGTFNPALLQGEGPFLTQEISFHDVGFSKGKAQFHFLGEESLGTYFNFINYEESEIYQQEKTAKDTLTKGTLQKMQALCCAQMVKKILEKGVLVPNGQSVEEKPNVKPNEIAILVRGAKENELISEALKQLGIASVYFSDKSSVLKEGDGDSIRATENAQVMGYLMESMAEPYNRRLVTRLLGSSLLAKNGEEFVDSLDEEKFEAEVKLLYEAKNLWRQVGFLAAFSLWFSKHDGVKNLLRFKGGERRVTDFYHIAELMQEKHSLIVGVQAQLRYYQNLIRDLEDDVSQESVKKRLESERSQIQVRTIHNSKGLEFPIVLMPFLWTYTAVRADASFGIIFYQENEGLTLDLASDEQSKELSKQGKIEEDVRLTYVALTRACAANFLFIVTAAKDGRSGSYSSFANLILDPKQGGALLKNTLQDSGKFTPRIIDVPTSFELYQEKASEKQEHYAVSTLDPKVLENDFTFTSYSSIVREIDKTKLNAYLGENIDRLDVEKEDVQDPKEENLAWRFYFPRGTRAGTFLHTMMEKCPFERATCSEDPLSGMVSELIANQDLSIQSKWISLINTMHIKRLTSQGEEVMEGDLAQEGEVSAYLTIWLKDIISAPLVGTLSLSSLKEGSYVPEMSYLLPVHQAKLSALDKIIKDNAKEIFKQNPTLYSREDRAKILGRTISDGVIDGFVNGSLDLVCTFGKEDLNRYYVIDYKSNYLGSKIENYAFENLERSLFEHCYDVQYLFYSLALHRLLRSRIKDYDYQKDFGGVIYLYLRGMQKGDANHGIYKYKVKEELIEKLDKLFD